MGTELGVYVSFDDGTDWQSLQLNLPGTPVTDLQVQRRDNDLVAATAGRAFWILDDLGPLQQLTDEVKKAKAYLFAPRPAIRVERGFSFGGAGRAGKNPPPGAIIDFELDAVDENTKVSLDILDESGAVVRHYPEKPVEGAGAAPFGPRPVPWNPKAGMNRVTWDLRHETPERVPGVFIFGALRGRKVVPGTYQVKLTVGEETRTQSIVVQKDPRLDTPLSAYQEQDDFLREVEADISEIHGGVNRLRKVRDQVDDFVKRAENQPNAEAVRDAGKALVDKMNQMEDVLIQKRTVDGQTVINFPVKLNHHFIILDGAVDSSEEGLIDGARDRLSDLSAEWQKDKAALDDLLGPELDTFNALVRDSGLPTVLSPVSK